ncbi:mCG147105 [Mus musculus]|nr:mCG147105 [Mus musculus]
MNLTPCSSRLHRPGAPVDLNTQSWLAAPLKGTLSAMIEVASYPGAAAGSSCQGSRPAF